MNSRRPSPPRWRGVWGASVCWRKRSASVRKRVLDNTRAVAIAACYAGCIARCWIEELTGIPCNVEIASEFRCRKFVTPPDGLFVTISQSGLEEVRTRGGQLYVFADAAAGIRNGDGVTVVEVPKTHELLSPVVYAVPLQLLACHTAVLKGTDVDQPRNLAKSVTVE